MSQIPEGETGLGFPDITEKLLSDDVCVEKFDVVKGVCLDGYRVQHLDDGSTSPVYYFYSRELKIRGRVFPNDEILSVGDIGDVIVQRALCEGGDTKWNLDCNWYHELHIGDRLTIRVSRRGDGKDPSFKIFNRITGFIKPYKRLHLFKVIKPGDIVEVEIMGIVRKDGRIHVLFKPIRLV